MENTKDNSNLTRKYNHSIQMNRIMFLLLLGAIYLAGGLGLTTYLALHIPTPVSDVAIVKETQVITQVETVVVEKDAPQELLPTYTFLATAYTSAPEENGGYGAVGCRDNIPLTEDAIAADLKLLPYGTRVYIEGVGERVVVDTASNKTITRRTNEALGKGAVGWIDIYCSDDKDAAHAWGVRLVRVTILEWGKE